MRTEKEVLKDFMHLGYSIYSNKEKVIFKWYDVEEAFYIDKSKQVFETTNDYFIDMNEYKLLHELFEIWGWLK